MTQPFSLKQTLTYVCLPVDRYERLRELERRLHENDSEDAIRSKEAAHVKNMQVVFAQQCQQYEATIANMQHQLAMASSGTTTLSRIPTCFFFPWRIVVASLVTISPGAMHSDKYAISA